MLDDPFDPEPGPNHGERNGHGLRSRRQPGKIEQRLRARGDDAGGVVTADRPRWVGLKAESPEARPDETAPAIFSEDVIEQDGKKLGQLPALLTQCRGDLQYLVRHPSDQRALDGVIAQAHGMNGLARETVFQSIYSMTSALESLLADLRATPERINQATLRTVTQSLDFMLTMAEPDNLAQTLRTRTPHVLAIDDEPDILEAIVGAMDMVNLCASGTTEPSIALDQLARESFDLIFLDVRMPGISGWDVCQQIRNIPDHRRTPIVFLTGMSTIENKVKSTLQGGNDFIGKPFNLRELGIKALTWVYRGQLSIL